ncbi:scarecrow-like protein 14-like protein, partial [Corchorus olitorius]
LFLGLDIAHGIQRLLGEQRHQLVADQRLVVLDRGSIGVAGDLERHVGLVHPQARTAVEGIVADEWRVQTDIGHLGRRAFLLFFGHCRCWQHQCQYHQDPRFHELAPRNNGSPAYPARLANPSPGWLMPAYSGQAMLVDPAPRLPTLIGHPSQRNSPDESLVVQSPWSGQRPGAGRGRQPGTEEERDPPGRARSQRQFP